MLEEAAEMAAEVSHGAETAEKASMLWRRPCVGGVDGEAMRALCQLGAGGDAEERLTQEAVELRWEGHGLVARAPAGREVDTSRDIVVRLRRQGERGVRSGSSGADERWLGSGLGLGLRGLRRAAGGGRRAAGGGWLVEACDAALRASSPRCSALPVVCT